MSDVMTVRPSLPSDLAALDALFAQSYPKLLKADYPPSVLVTAVPLLARAQPRLLASGTYYVVEVDGRIIGAGGWSPRRDRRMAEVRHVVTAADRTRRGVGRRLFDSIFEAARAARNEVLMCQSTRTAVPFYKAMGFVAGREISVPLRPGIVFPVREMHRRL